MMIPSILKKIPLRGSFETVLFWGVLFFCFLAALASTIFTAIEDLGTLSIIYSIGIMLYFIVVGAIAYRTHKTEGCYTAMTFGITTLILPPMFFICGAFDSGMPFYCLTSILVTALISNKKHRYIMAAYALLVFTATFIVDWNYPHFSQDLEPFDTLVDQIMSFIFMGILITAIVSYLLFAYNREKREKDAVIEKLNYLSTHDPLTGLFNRRSFIDVIRNKVQPNPSGYYLLMFDIDYFKRINDNYSHLFGDTVLAAIGKLAQSTFNDEGEIAVRYGGEEFILLLRAENYNKGMVKAEQFRNNVSALTFEEQPDVHIHISGGFVDCSNPDFANYDKLLTAVDKRLYAAKSNGRNQIVGEK